jgi:hypothetical protein
VEDEDTDIADDFQIPEAIAITDNKIKGDLQFKANKASFGVFSISGNYIRENLECFDNEPPFVGSGNFTRGEAQGGCAGLTAEP